MEYDSFDNHVLLYSKNWYGRSGDGVISDLKVLLSKFSEIDIKDISDRDIIQLLSSAFAKFVKNEYEISEAIIEMTGYKWLGWWERFNRKPEEVMVGKLSIVGGEHVNMSKKMDICFGKKVLQEIIKEELEA